MGWAVLCPRTTSFRCVTACPYIENGIISLSSIAANAGSQDLSATSSDITTLLLLFLGYFYMDRQIGTDEAKAEEEITSLLLFQVYAFKFQMKTFDSYEWCNSINQIYSSNGLNGVG